VEPSYQLELTASPFETLDVLIKGRSEGRSEMLIHWIFGFFDDFTDEG